jgi:heat shock protein HslJ
MGSIGLTEDGALSWGPAGLAVTRRAGPPMLMELESIFFESLERTTSATLDGSRLVFSSTEPALSLVFEEQAAPATAADYLGRQMTVTALNVDGVNYNLPAQPKLNLTISRDGRCAGFSGVNRFFGTLKIAPGGGVTAGPFGSTMMAGPEALMKLEQAYMKAIAATRQIESAGGAVRFLNQEGTALVTFEVR